MMLHHSSRRVPCREPSLGPALSSRRPHVGNLHKAAAAVSSTPVPPATAVESSKPTRKLILMRHADSEGSSSGIRDHDRSISSRGRLEAASMARQLSELAWLPDLIIASNARRTRQTLDLMAEAVAAMGEADAHFLGSLYTVAALDGQTRSHLEACIAELASDSRVGTVMCIGHNKGWEEAAASLAGQPLRLKTATAALLQQEGSWGEVLQKDVTWQLMGLVSPEI